MKTTRIHTIMAVALMGWLLAGCAPMAVTGAPEVDKTAFGSKKRYAVVSIASAKTFHGERSLGDTFKDADQVPGANTQPLVNKLAPQILAKMGQSRQFTLVPESRVLGQRAYRAMAEDERTMKFMMFSSDMNVASGYKFLTDPQKYARLAQDLGVDGVIGVFLNFSISSGGGRFSISGLSLGKKSYSATATVSALAYNRKGEVVWKDSTIKMADPDDSRAIVIIDTSSFTGADFEKMHPSALDIGGKAIDVLLSRFDDTLAGRDVERMQSLK